MNSWEFARLELFICGIIFIYFIFLIIALILAIKHHKHIRLKVIQILIIIMVFSCLLLFNASHSTYYKYNDWRILNSNIHNVYEKYGEFDIGSIQDGKSGKVAYYIYKDEGHVMSDHLAHYYWIYYDENGIVYNVKDLVHPGG